MEILYNNNYWKEKFNSITKCKVLLNKYFYSDDVMEYICNQIQNTFDIFNILYSDKNITIKIKKTNLKKNDTNYIHCAQYYYPYINDILINTFLSFKDKLLVIFNNDKQLLDLLFYRESINSLYNLTTLLDNIIMIKL